jgi:hypothetical protein
MKFSTTNLPLIITVAAGVFGVVLGALLRPIAEDWFARRRKTLHVVIDFVNVVKTPHESVKLEWRDHKIDKLVVFGFKVKNRTGRTLRNFALELSLQSTPSEADFAYITLQGDRSARFEEVRNTGTSAEYKFQYIKPKGSASGSVVASYQSALSAFTMDDYEVKITKSSDVHIGKLLGQVMGALTFAAAASAIAALVSAILG